MGVMGAVTGGSRAASEPQSQGWEGQGSLWGWKGCPYPVASTRELGFWSWQLGHLRGGCWLVPREACHLAPSCASLQALPLLQVCAEGGCSFSSCWDTEPFHRPEHLGLNSQLCLLSVSMQRVTSGYM